MNSHHAIGLFDSGIGGLTVFREISRLLPHENLIYFGDVARLPYGNKEPQTILRYVLECVDFLLEQNIKLLVIACHTAAAHVLRILEKELPIPVLGVIQPSFELLMQTTRSKRVAILGTESTIASHIYQDLIFKEDPQCRVFAVACPLFVPLVEEQFLNHAATDLIAAHYLHPLTQNNIDTALLACTHYPILRRAIHRALGPSIQILEPASRCAEQARTLLTTMRLLNDQQDIPNYQLFTTDHPSRCASLAQLFLGHSLSFNLSKKQEMVKILQTDQRHYDAKKENHSD